MGDTLPRLPACYELTQAMVDAAASKSDTIERLKNAGLGYVSFALRRAEHFTPAGFNSINAERRKRECALV